MQDGKPRFRGARLALLVPLLALAPEAAHGAGALAIDSNQGDRYGFSYGYSRQADANGRALSECGGGCTIVLQFRNTCGAYAADQAPGSTAYGWATAATGAAAQSRAIAECQARGSNCVVRVWACDE